MAEQKPPALQGSLLIDSAILEGNTHIDVAFADWEETFVRDEQMAIEGYLALTQSGTLEE